MNNDWLRSVRLPCDLAGYVRRSCATCHHAFRSRPWEDDGSAVSRRLHRCLSHDNPDELFQLSTACVFHCPYCGRLAATDAFFTEAQQRGVKELAISLHQWIRFEQLRGGLNRERFLVQPTFIPVPPAPLPKLSEPEDDFEIAFFSCCDEDVKVEKDWSAPLHCLHCGRRQGGTPKATFLLPQASA